VVRLQLLPAGEGAALFDSNQPGAQRPFSLADLRPLLLPGEALTVRREGQSAVLLKAVGTAATQDEASPWIDALIRRLPVEGYDAPLSAREVIATPLGRYELELTGNLRPVNRQLAAVATRMTGFVGAMLGAVLLTWLSMEVILIRRMTLLTKRAAALSTGVRAGAPLPALELADLRGGDELGVLSQGLHDLLQRVNADVQREQIRAQQEKDQWHAVGHEIMSPLQSLMALHGQPGDPAERYITRMQQAIRVLYGQASPSEAFEATTLDLAPLDLNAFLGDVAANAGYIGIGDVAYTDLGTIADSLLERIFEYGVSGEAGAAADGQRGQGLFVVRTYLAKMGGTVRALNVDGGVCFEWRLPLAG